jgi:hypothetical protein
MARKYNQMRNLHQKKRKRIYEYLISRLDTNHYVTQESIMQALKTDVGRFELVSKTTRKC